MNIPKTEDEKELNALAENKATEVKVGGKTYRIGALRGGVIRKMTDVILNEKVESKVSAKCCALILLGRLWKIALFYWIAWRWIYYVKEYTEDELRPVIEEAKKKVPVEAYLINTILLTGMRDTVMSMTREEVRRIRPELSGEEHQQ